MRNFLFTKIYLYKANKIYKMDSSAKTIENYTFFTWNSDHNLINDINGSKTGRDEVAKKVKTFINDDNVVALQSLVDSFSDMENNKIGIRFSNQIFTYCHEVLAPNCFNYLYSLITDSELKKEKKFLKHCVEMAQNGKCFDGDEIWSPSKRLASNAKPAKYKIPRESIVPEECFVAALSSGANLHQKEKAKEMVRTLMKLEIPIGNVLICVVNDDSNIQGYGSMLHRYFCIENFIGMYQSKKKNNARQEIKNNGRN